MKLTPQDLAMFKVLSGSDVGLNMTDYLKRVIDYIHDSRSWKGDEDKNSASLAGRAIDELIVKKIKPSQTHQKVGEVYE